VKTSAISKSRILLTIFILFTVSSISFNSCKKNATLPVLTTDNATGVTQTSATSGGTITDDGGASIESRGLCWSTSANPTTSGDKVTVGSGTGSFTGTLTSLLPGTQYNVRAYATNSAGTGYGNQVTFTTEQTPEATLTTTVVTSVTATTAVSGGNITSDGGEPVTERGVCWSTSQDPTIDDSKISDASGGTGIFTSNLENLLSSTKYYVRAYATNSAGTAYGNQESFTTLQGPYDVMIMNMAFSPATITVPANTTVTWTNLDGATHSVTSDAKSFDSNAIGTNEKYSYTFTIAGSYSYHCKYHPSMKGTVEVN
jgi:plastocyanin